MNPEERSAEKYLVALSKGNVVFEPDGNVPPDFSLGGTTGVEVRRLNENYFGLTNTKGLEEVSIPLHQKLGEVLTSYDNQFDGRSYWIGLTYNRPLQGSLRSVGKDMRETLDGFLLGPRTTPTELVVSNGLSLEIIAASAVPNHVFRHGLTSDDDSGGLVADLYTQNILHCIQEKEVKIAPHRSRYQTWFLLLVDTLMAWNLVPDEVARVRSRIVLDGGFEKLLVIDYAGNNCLLDIGLQLAQS